MRTSTPSQNARQFLTVLFQKLGRLINRFPHFESGVATSILAAIIFILALFYFLERVDSPFYHDSLYYWDLANSFDGEKFSFANYSNALRGYFFPFLLFLIKKKATLLGSDPRLLFQINIALFFTFLSIYIIPWSFHTLFRWRIHLWGRGVIALALFFFWRGYFLYPLSDFPAFTFLLIGVTLLVSSLRNSHVPYWVVFVGMFIGAAVNTRPIYQISLIFLIPFVLIQVYEKGLLKGLIWLSFVFLGFGLISFPQLQINWTHFNIKSPLVLARIADDENLYLKQLFWGLGTQRYETTIGDNFPSNAVTYRDPFIENLDKTNLLREKDTARYIKIMQRFPLEISVSYFRHLFNGLDIFFPTPYIPNIFAKHVFLSAINYLIWFLVIFKLVTLDLTKRVYANTIGLMSLLAPVVLAIPTVVEVRFFLPAYVLAYGVVAFGLDYSSLIKTHLDNGWKILRFFLLCSFWIMICFTLSNTTMEYLVR
jgi:hypothetical protein